MSKGERLVPVDLPAIERKKIIYLDQNVIGNIMAALHPDERPKQPASVIARADAIFAKLDRLRKAQCIVCPYSWDHRRESVVAHKYFVSLMKVYTYLANDIRFVSAFDIQKRQLALFTEAWFQGDTSNIDYADDSVFESHPHHWYWRQENMPFSYVTYDGEADETRAIRDLFDAGLTNTYNEWREKSEEQVYQEERNGFLIWLLKCVRQITGVESYEGITRDDMAECMNIMITLLHVLQRRGELESSKERITQMLEDKELSDKIPFIKYSAVMNMCLARRVKTKPQPLELGEWQGEVTDISRISNYATYCDAIFTDKYFAEQLEDDKIKRLIGGNCRFYHLKKYECFMEYLEGIEGEYKEQIAESEKILGSIEPSFDLLGLSK